VVKKAAAIGGFTLGDLVKRKDGQA